MKLLIMVTNNYLFVFPSVIFAYCWIYFVHRKRNSKRRLCSIIGNRCFGNCLLFM